MSRRYLLLVLAALVGLLGAISIAGVLAFQDIPLAQRLTAPLNGLLLLVAVWLLIRRRLAAVALLGISALVYCLSYVGPSVANNGFSGLTMFMPAFYLSVSARVAVSLFAYWLLKPREFNA